MRPHILSMYAAALKLDFIHVAIFVWYVGLPYLAYGEDAWLIMQLENLHDTLMWITEQVQNVVAKRSAIEKAQGVPVTEQRWDENQVKNLVKYYKELHQDPVIEELVPDTYPDAWLFGTLFVCLGLTVVYIVAGGQ